MDSGERYFGQTNNRAARNQCRPESHTCQDDWRQKVVSTGKTWIAPKIAQCHVSSRGIVKGETQRFALLLLTGSARLIKSDYWVKAAGWLTGSFWQYTLEMRGMNFFTSIPFRFE